MDSANAPDSTKRKTVVTPDKNIQKKTRRHRYESKLETKNSSSNEIYEYSNEDVKKDITKLQENQHGESKVSSSSSDNLDKDVIDLKESSDKSDNKKSNTVAATKEEANLATPWETAIRDEITLLKDVEADINSSEDTQEDEMESSSAERCGEEIRNKESDTLKKELSSESLPDLVPSHPQTKCKSDADEEDDSNYDHNSSGVYDSDASNEILPDLVPSKPETDTDASNEPLPDLVPSKFETHADADADETNDGLDLPENYAMKPVLRRSPRRNRNNEGNMEDVCVKDTSDQSIPDYEEMSNEGDEEEQDADYQRDMEIQQNLINIFKDLPRKSCKKADKEWKALLAAKQKRKVVRIRQMRNELSAFYPKSDKHGESISYWDIKNRYIATSSRLVPSDIVERSDENQNQAVGDAIAFLNRPKEELKHHAKNSGFFAPEHKSGTYTRAVNIYRRFCGITDIHLGRDMGMKAGDIIALMVSGEIGLGRVFFGVIEDSTLLLKSPKACKEMQLPATKLFNRTPDPRFNGIILRNVRWMRHGMARELPWQKTNQVTWLCESAPGWYMIIPEKNNSMEILSNKEFIDSTYPISYEHIDKA